jgi:hypothetical protein
MITRARCRGRQQTAWRRVLTVVHGPVLPRVRKRGNLEWFGKKSRNGGQNVGDLVQRWGPRRRHRWTWCNLNARAHGSQTQTTGLAGNQARGRLLLASTGSSEWWGQAGLRKCAPHAVCHSVCPARITRCEPAWSRDQLCGTPRLVCRAAHNATLVFCSIQQRSKHIS